MGDDEDNDDDTPGADHPKSRTFLSADEKSAGACSEVTILPSSSSVPFFCTCEKDHPYNMASFPSLDPTKKKK